MLIIALIIHLLGHHLPLWLTKTKTKEVRANFHWKQVLFEMSGMLTDFTLAILIVIILTLTSKEKYLLNDDAIYGIECSENIKAIGFNDGDKIVSINNHEVVRFNDILSTILLEVGEVNVNVSRNNMETIIQVSEEDKISIISGKVMPHIKPKLSPDSNKGIEFKPLIYQESSQGIGDAFHLFWGYIKMNLSYFSPTQPKHGFGGIAAITTVKGMFNALAFSLVLIGVINLFPLPGLSLGNVFIAIIEKIRKRKFNVKTMKIIRISCISLIVLFFISLLFLI